MALPKADGPYGYTKKLVNKICRERGVDSRKFWNHFGVNTCAIDRSSGKEVLNYYGCDIERTLYVLGAEDGKPREWD